MLADHFAGSGRLHEILQRAFPGWDAERDDVGAAPARHETLSRHFDPSGIVPMPTSAEQDDLATARERALERHTVYALAANHDRVKPFVSNWIGHCQSVRVSLPATPEQARTIYTRIGRVEPSDHLAFSVQQIVDGYAAQFGTTPRVERVDLITGARILSRFSPISIYLAYAQASDSQPIFYVLESGSAQGNPEVLYFAPQMGVEVHQQAGFQFTPFACKTNWYTGSLTMDSSGAEPARIDISIAQENDGARHYLDLHVGYAVSEPTPVIHPLALQIQAAMRVFAIAQGMGCELEWWESGLGDIARSTFEWIDAPPRKGSGEGYSGCSTR